MNSGRYPAFLPVSYFSSRYNLKRRIADLPALSFPVWNENVLSAQRLSKEAEASGSFRKACLTCQKVYSSVNAYENHLRSQKHLQHRQDSAPSELLIAEDTSILDRTEPDADNAHEDNAALTERVPPTMTCLFCNSSSPTLENNLQHMNKVHGLFVPYQDRLRDLEGLVAYLSRIVHQSHACLYCGTSRNTVEGIQHHMRDKGHCMIAFEEDSEADTFYGSSADALGSQMERTNLNEEQEPASDVEEADLHSPAEYTNLNDDLELRLPSGKILGHRSQSRYYRQNLYRYPTPSERAEQRVLLDTNASTATDSLSSDDKRLATRSHFEKGLLGVPKLQIRALMAKEKKDVSKEIKAKISFEWSVQLKNNRQKHYNVGAMFHNGRSPANSNSRAKLPIGRWSISTKRLIITSGLSSTRVEYVRSLLPSL